MLTEREKQVLKLLCLPNSEIAQRLNITARTVKAHVRHIFNKFACSNRAEAIAKAIKKGIIKADEIITD